MKNLVHWLYFYFLFTVEWVEYIYTCFKWAGIEIVTQLVNYNNGGRGGATDWHAMCACVCAPVYLIRCVLEQVSQVDAVSLCRALWALCEHCYWMARGLPVAMGGI